MMSSQTTDIVNEAAMRRLHEACPGGITIDGLEALGEERIAATIKPVSFYTPKVGFWLAVCVFGWLAWVLGLGGGVAGFMRVSFWHRKFDGRNSSTLTRLFFRSH